MMSWQSIWKQFSRLWRGLPTSGSIGGGASLRAYAHLSFELSNFLPRHLDTLKTIRRSVETWDFCLQHDYMYSYLSYYGYKRAQKVMQGFWHKAEELGKDLNPYRVGYAQIVAVADSDQEAERLYSPHIDYFFNRCLHVHPGFADAPGYRTQETLRAGFVPQVGATASAVRGQMTWKDFVEHGFVVAGSAATVRDTLREALTGMRAGHVMLLCQMGDMPDALARENTQRFATDVMPELRGLWSDYEDHWYPQPWGETATL